MELEVEEFIAKFHNLTGNAIGERKKSLNLLLTKIPQDHDAVIASLQPNNHLEQLFKLQLIIKLERIPELVEILKSEDEHIVAKLLKNKWFCQKFASMLEENCAGFVSGVLPSMSYVTRRRLLDKLAIYGNNLDTIFEEVYHRYGLHIASDVLLGCTETKIKEVLAECYIKLTQFQLKLLFEKFPSVFQIYIIQHQGDYIEESVGAYVAAKDTNAFIELANQSNLIANLGKRLTKKLLRNFKEFVITRADKFINSLHARTLIKTLGIEDFKRFYFKCFPSNIKYFYGSFGFHNLGKTMGRRYYPLLLEGVKKQYNKSLYDYPNLINQEMMETMEITEREKWVVIKRKSDMDLIEFLKTSESIPAIKRKINVTSSIKERQNLIQLLVQTCRINQDVDALAEVAEYVSLRHRNDDSVLLTQFLVSLKHHFDLKKLEERHWKSILSLIRIIKLKETEFYHEQEFATSHIEFLFLQKKLKDEDILKYVKNLNTTTDYWNLEICDDLKKIIALKLIDTMPELMEKDQKLHHHDLRSIKFIINWNRRHPDDQILISDHPRLVDSFRKSINDAISLDEYIPQLYILKSILKLIICKKEKLDLRDEALSAYFLLGNSFYDLDIDLWLLKFQPETISANFPKFLEHLSHCYQPNLELLLWVKKYSHLGFPERIVNFALEKLGANETGNNIFRILAVLSSSEKYLQCISPYFPSEDKMDVDEDNEESKKKRDDAIEVACSLKYTTSVEVLPTVLGYCKGDFLRYTLESMYYLFYHLPENRLSNFLNELSTKAVSARKHAIFLTCIVGSVADVQTLLTRFIEKERNVSVQKHLFTAAFKYFTKNPSDNLWESLKICMTKLDKSDDESFGTLVELRRIPVKYQVLHVVFVWEILKKTGGEDRYKWRLLSSLPSSVIKKLPLQFLLEIIAESFLKNQEVDLFIVSCLTKTDFKTEILKAMFDAVLKLKALRNENYENLGHHKRFLEVIGSFVTTFVSKIAIEERNGEILQLFSRKWYQLFMDKETEVIEEHLQITFARFYCQFGDEDLLRLNKANMDFLRELMMTYGIGIVDTFARILKTTFSFYNEDNKAFFDLCMDIIARNELIFYLLVIELLPKSEPSGNENLEKFRKIIQLLRGTNANLILLSLNRYIRNLSLVK